MKKTTITLYDYDELSQDAKEKALAAWRADISDPLMQSHMGNLVGEELDARKIGYEASSINCMYDLSNSQGSGLMFEGILFDDYGNRIRIKHKGHYYHEHSCEIDYPEAKDQDYENFEKIYVEICQKVRDLGYDYIEEQESEETFEQNCEANGYLFDKYGNLRKEE